MAYELIVRFGDVREAETPREAEVYTFNTEAERDAYKDGIIRASRYNQRDFVERNPDGTIPQDSEWFELFGEE
jgi:hypothetical protein